MSATTTTLVAVWNATSTFQRAVSGTKQAHAAQYLGVTSALTWGSKFHMQTSGPIAWSDARSIVSLTTQLSLLNKFHKGTLNGLLSRAVCMGLWAAIAIPGAHPRLSNSLIVVGQTLHFVLYDTIFMPGDFERGNCIERQCW